MAFASSLDQVGVFARSARDCAVVLATIAGADDADSTSLREPVPDYAADLDRGIRGVRFGVVGGIVDKLDAAARTNFEEALSVIRNAGGEIVTVTLPSMKYAIAVYYIVANAEASANLARFDGMRYGRRAGGDEALRETYVHSRTEGFGDEVKRRIMLGTFALSSGYYEAYYGRAQKARRLMKAEFSSVFRGVDALLTPTTPTPAFRKGEKMSDPLSMYLSDIFTAPANLVGIPALAIPSGFSGEGLPLSLQLMGPELAEGLLLRVAQVFETATGHARRAPGAAD